ncbi:hypothetical protein JCM8547_004020 [Rhodosporidiobolus lusitaniae]
MSATFDNASENEIKSPNSNGARTLFTYKEGQRIIRKFDSALVPLLMAAVRTMNTGTNINILRQLNISADKYSYTSTVFTVFVVLAEVPYGFSFASGSRGISGWQWVYMTQGFAGVIMSLAIWIWMPNYPDMDTCLTPEEREWRAIKDKVNVCFAICLMLYQSGVLSYQFWLPTVFTNLGFSGTASKQLLNILPAFLYWVSGVCGSWINKHAFFLPRPFCFSTAIAGWSACLAALAFESLYAIICIASFFSN